MIAFAQVSYSRKISKNIFVPKAIPRLDLFYFTLRGQLQGGRVDIILEAGKVIAEANNHESQVILTGLDGVNQRYALFKDGLSDLTQGKTLGSELLNSLYHILLRIRPV